MPNHYCDSCIVIGIKEGSVKPLSEEYGPNEAPFGYYKVCANCKRSAKEGEGFYQHRGMDVFLQEKSNNLDGLVLCQQNKDFHGYTVFSIKFNNIPVKMVTEKDAKHIIELLCHVNENRYSYFKDMFNELFKYVDLVRDRLEQDHKSIPMLIDDIKELMDSQKGPCDHPGCMSHITHPCESCGTKWGEEGN